jgi:hypothetical protein
MTHYTAPELTNPCSYPCCVLSGDVANTRSDPTGARTHNLPHWKRANNYANNVVNEYMDINIR